MFIPIAKPNLSGNELKYVTECINTGWISSNGKFVTEFEEKFAHFCNTKYATSTTSGTSALHLALLALDIKEGDEVIVPNMTFATTANVVKYCNAKEVLVEVNKDTFNIDTNKIEEKITSKTKAIIVVHLYGFICDMEKIMSLAKKHNLYVIEDAAESFGSVYDKKKAGSLGHIGCFSFFGNKTLTTGEGGMCTTNDKNIYEKIKIFKNHGMTHGKGYWHDIVGYNYRMTNLQAAVGLAQMEKADEIIRKRDQIANWYKRELKDTNGIKFQQKQENEEPSYWMICILLDKDFKLSVEELANYLKENDVDSRRGFIPLNEMPPYFSKEEFLVSRDLYNRQLILPTYFDLKEEEVIKICNLIKNATK